MANPSEVHIYPPSVVSPHSKRLISRCFTRVAAIVLLTVSLTSQSLAAPVDVNTADGHSHRRQGIEVCSGMISAGC